LDAPKARRKSRSARACRASCRSVYYDEGSFVRAGAPLFQIERAPFEIALAQAKATADQMEATNDQARREADRLAGLLASAAVSKRLAEEAATAYKSAAASLAPHAPQFAKRS
jgi:multidrug resistance efflux pump